MKTLDRFLQRPRPDLAVPETHLVRADRRLFLRGGLVAAGSLALGGCDISDNPQVESTLGAISRLNDRVQAALFGDTRLAPTFDVADITPDFPFNAYYPASKIRVIDGSTWKLELAGLVSDKAPWTLDRLRTLPQEAQITRHVCVEGWSAIGQWSGVPFRTFLERIGADTTARYVGFTCGDDYWTSIDMPSALHPQTILALDYAGAPLPPKYGYPVKLRIPTKLGFKNPKHIMAITVTNEYPGGYWEDQGYNWFSGL
ncbi:molybdopterin-dependent oxidoreductase [Methylobacterium sp. J-068]|uniref:molybdopterin-dependent oxidoreductase n=1 Tax=Methylobacterium sp. J-068 TaxID=2836649 RepID=UPI001FBAAF5E|nr:molybdopterin-dependent oxidoreductase [Methylobacterium sp. J-068]MCJ2036444.1 molybdopterin-dependent oxidoreductase [Methylobacterium sp. J-068]